MKAIGINPSSRKLEVLDLPPPDTPPPGHVIVDIEACGINHGDKLFLAMPGAAGGALNGANRAWGVSAAGKVTAIGEGVPEEFLGKSVALYRSLGTSARTVGVWSEKAQLPYTSCVILPDDVPARDYCGSLVNAFTSHAFLEDIVAAGHRGVIATAGASATALALAVLAKKRQVPVIHLVRSQAQGEEIRRCGLEHVIATDGEGFEDTLAQRAETLGTTAVFDGLGGALINRIAPHVPMNTSVYIYGALDASTPVTIPSRLFLSRNLAVNRFSNFNSATAKDPARLAAAMAELRDVIADPLFRTKAGQAFRFEEIDAAMAYRGSSSARAVLVPPAVPLRP
ncbi:alcohol dehydrogenase catalytic domain-containing protein [Burkholderia gladioli]|uniref:alcohol dehydrogenase catalytic domain-containing protein n=1 Tax=Burkholderia gladioli TaxID=28095 RepID=UPI001641A52B|nr:Zn-dependent oxidoreductase [Burkholderia gladioli]